MSLLGSINKVGSCGAWSLSVCIRADVFAEAGKALPPALLSLLSVQRALQLEYDDTDDIVLSDEPPPAEPARQFECRHCGKRYRWKSTLRRHENVECGGKAPAHQCPHCAYRAKQRGNLGVHIRKHHTAEWCLYAGNKMRRNKKALA